MRHHAGDDIRERAVVVVVVKRIGDREVVRDIQVRPAVVIEVPPDRRVPVRRPRGDTGAVRHVGERAVAVVVEEIVPLTLRMGRRIKHIGLDEDIEPAVAIVVAEVGHDAGVVHVEPVRVRLLLERAVALVDVEQVWRIEPAHVDVEQAVIVYVDEGRALLPDPGGRAVVADPGLFRNVLEFPIAEIAKEPATLRLAHDKNVRPAVVVVVADGHSGADRTEIELTGTSAPNLRVVVLVLDAHAAVLGRDDREEGLAAWAGSRGEQLHFDAAGGYRGRIGRGAGPGAAEGERRQHPGQHRAGANSMPYPAEYRDTRCVLHVGFSQGSSQGFQRDGTATKGSAGLRPATPVADWRYVAARFR